MQSITRSKLARLRLRRALKTQAAEQEEEVRQWSVLVIQKVARGYIARRTVVRSMQIRKTLHKEVLRIAEQYLQHGDLWGFLKDINDELTRSRNELQENQAREDDWAKNFVEKVVHKRQSEFNTAWEEFPKALREFSGKDDDTGVLLTKLGASGAKKPARTGGVSPLKQSSTTQKSPAKALTIGAAGTTPGAAITAGASLLSTATSVTALSAATGTSLTAAGKTGGRTSPLRGSKRTQRGNNARTAVITAEEVGSAMAYDQLQALKTVEGGEQSHLSVPGECDCNAECCQLSMSHLFHLHWTAVAS
jgi:hypothetical protein